MITKIVKKIPGKLFLAKDEGGYNRLYFKPSNGKLLVMASWNGGGYYEDVFFEKVENEKPEVKVEEPQELKDGKWQPATQVPYYPNLVEKIGHFFGKHYYYESKECLLCGKQKGVNSSQH